MPLIQDLRGLFSRRKPVVVDLSHTQASSLTHNGGWPEDEIDDGPIPEPVVESTPNQKRNGRSRNAIEVTSGMEEVIGMAKTIATHLENQSAATARMQEYMERLPQALEALPELNRQNARLLEIISDHLHHAKQRDDALNDTLAELGGSSVRHTEILGLIQQQLDANQQTTGMLVENLTTFRGALSDLAASNTQTAEVLGEMSRASEAREKAITTMLGRTQKWMAGAMVCCAAASLTAVVLAAFTLFN